MQFSIEMGSMRHKKYGLDNAFLGLCHRGGTNGAVVSHPGGRTGEHGPRPGGRRAQRLPSPDDGEKEVGKVKIHARTALAGFLLVATFFLWKEPRAYFLGALPLALLLLCPILHFFMHRGHGGQGEEKE